MTKTANDMSQMFFLEHFEQIIFLIQILNDFLKTYAPSWISNVSPLTGYIGCMADVLSIMDKACSGKSQCQVQVPTPELDDLHACPEDFKSYLEAGYRCQKG